MKSDQEKINKAIRDCLEFCYQSEQIIPQIAEFLSTLKTANGWQKSEIREVEIAVLRVLHGIMDYPKYPGDATDVPASDVGLPDSKSAKMNGI